MNPNPFRAGGALGDELVSVYVERDADIEALKHLRAMAYLLIIEPRQQGKTSLLSHLYKNISSAHTFFAYVSVEDMVCAEESKWYHHFCNELTCQLTGLAGVNSFSEVTDAPQWRRWMETVAHAAMRQSSTVIIALDEVGALARASWAESFFASLRKLYNKFAFSSVPRNVTFVLCGTFHPRDLIKDNNISPFNVAVRVRLEDFTLEQVQKLVSWGPWSGEPAQVIASRIHYWTDGQPYLTQLLCSLIAEDTASLDVDGAIERLRRAAISHLPPIIAMLNQDDKLRQYASQINKGKSIKYYPPEHPRQAQLELLGVLKADESGYCRIRNRIYELALFPRDSLTFACSVPATEKDVTMIIPRELIEQLSKGNVVLFCGAGISTSDGGIPSGGQLVRELAVRAGLGDVGSVSLPEVAQAYEIEMGTQSLIAYVTDRVDDPHYSPLPTHQLIAALPFKRIITTNWDNLLEEALRQALKPFTKVVRDSEVPFTDDDKALLIKLHGSIEQKDTIVITGDDYYDVFARLPETANLVRGFFSTKTLLFLGYGLADEDFKRMYHEVERHLGKHKRRAYAVQLNPTTLVVKYWGQKNVEIIAADVTVFLEALAAQRATHSASPVPNQEIRPPTFGMAQPDENPTTGHGQSTASGPPAKSTSSSSLVEHNMDYERGLEAMKRLAAGTEWFSDFTLYEARLRENLRDERRYGSSPQTNQDRSRVVEQLNTLALNYLKVSFNDLCMGKHAVPQSQTHPSDPEVIERLRRIEEKIDQGLTEDRESAAKILDALAQNRVAQDEANKMMADLQAWAQGIQQAGLPLSLELRAAMDALTEHSGSAYQYLQVALPIIPGILTYNVELGSQHQADLRALWERIKTRFGG